MVGAGKKIKQEKSQIKLGAILSYLSIALNVLAGFLYTPWMIEQIGDIDYGLYTLASSLISLLLIDFGLGGAASRFVSKFVAEGRLDKANAFLGAIYKLYLFLDAVICLAFLTIFFFLEQIYVSLSPEELQKLEVVYCIVASYAVFSFPFVTLNGMLTAYERFVHLKLADIINRIFTVGLTVVALLAGMGLYALVATHAISGLITITYKYIAVRRTTPLRVSFGRTNSAIYKEIFAFSIWGAVAVLAQRLILNITPSILGVVSSSKEIAVFGIVAQIEAYSYILTTAINGMFLPRISRIYAHDPQGNLIMPLLTNVGRFQFALNGLLIVGFGMLGGNFLRLWVGENFGNAYWGILLVILPGLFFNPLQIANTAMIVQNKVREQACIEVVCGIVNITISWILSKHYGAIGASFSVFVAYSIRAVLYHIVIHKSLHINIGLFVKKCYWKMLPSILVTLIVGVCINCLIDDAGWMIFCVKGAILATTYGVTTFALGLTREERNVLKGRLFAKKFKTDSK